MTQSQIAAHFGISRMHVFRLIHTSCRRVRDEAARDEQPGEDAQAA